MRPADALAEGVPRVSRKRRRNKKLSRRELTKLVRAERGLRILPAHEAERPKVRADCIDQPRPCPWVSCRHHTFLEVTRDGLLKLNHPLLSGPEAMERRSCSLDAPDPRILENVGDVLGISRERTRQLEAEATAKIAARLEMSVPEVREVLAQMGCDNTECGGGYGEMLLAHNLVKSDPESTG